MFHEGNFFFLLLFNSICYDSTKFCMSYFSSLGHKYGRRNCYENQVRKVMCQYQLICLWRMIQIGVLLVHPTWVLHYELRHSGNIGFSQLVEKSVKAIPFHLIVLQGISQYQIVSRNTATQTTKTYRILIANFEQQTHYNRCYLLNQIMELYEVWLLNIYLLHYLKRLQILLSCQWISI